MTKIIESRNKREGGYAGWRATGGRRSLNGNDQPIKHERAGGHANVKKCISLKGWARLRGGGCQLP